MRARARPSSAWIAGNASASWARNAPMSDGRPGGRPGRRVISSVGTSQTAPSGSAATRRGAGTDESERRSSTAASRAAVKSGSSTAHSGRAQRRRTRRWVVPRRSTIVSAWLACQPPSANARIETILLPRPTESAAQRSMRSGGGRRGNVLTDSHNAGRVPSNPALPRYAVSPKPRGQPARESAPPYRAEGVHALWHVSEDASIEAFRPHRARSASHRDPVVRAVDTTGATPTVGESGLPRSSAVAQDVEVMAVEHDAQHVAERVDERGGDEAGATLGDSLELRGPERHQPLQGGRDVVDVPVHERAAWPGAEFGRRKSSVDDAQLVLVVGDAELDVARPAPRGLAGEVRLGTQHLGVPAGRRR